MILIGFIIVNCGRTEKKSYISDFRYEKHDAVGPEGLVCFVKVHDQNLKSVLLQANNHLTFKYSGGIYNIDTLYFPSPIVNILSVHDSTLVLGQGVFGLRRYTDSFLDSIVLMTKKGMTLEIRDTLKNETWTLTTQDNLK